MAKSINWPEVFREEILAENTTDTRLALRLGSLYYDNHYWMADERVDIRANQVKIRDALIVGDLQQRKIDELTAVDFKHLKSTLQSQAAVIAFLQDTYQTPVTAETPVTLVHYRNLPDTL